MKTIVWKEKKKDNLIIYYDIIPNFFIAKAILKIDNVSIQTDIFLFDTFEEVESFFENLKNDIFKHLLE